MRYLIDGYDDKEILDMLNISEVALRTQLSKGKAKLQELLSVKTYHGSRY